MQVELVIEAAAWEGVALERLAQQASKAVARELGLEGAREISLLACDDARIAALNGQFRGKAGPTNVLSWPSVDLSAEIDGGSPDLGEAEVELGDIAIAFETCAREAEGAGKSLEDHVTHLLVHGILHLLGYDHERDADGDLMEALESRILGQLGIADPYGP